MVKAEAHMWNLQESKDGCLHNGVGVQEAQPSRYVQGHLPALQVPLPHAGPWPLQVAPQVAALHKLHHQHRLITRYARTLQAKGCQSGKLNLSLQGISTNSITNIVSSPGMHAPCGQRMTYTVRSPRRDRRIHRRTKHLCGIRC